VKRFDTADKLIAIAMLIMVVAFIGFIGFIIIHILTAPEEPKVITEPAPAKYHILQEEMEQAREDIKYLHWEIQELKDALEEIDLLTFEATAYAPLDPRAVEGMCYSGDPTETYTGLPLDNQAIAVDPDVIPLGSWVWVKDFGWMQARDIGGNIKGHRIDLFMQDRDDALTWGRRDVQVLIPSRNPETTTNGLGI